MKFKLTLALILMRLSLNPADKRLALPKQLTYPWITPRLINKSLSLFNNAHALLVAGQQGLGKSFMVAQMCRDLLVEASSPQSRHLYDVGSHPDLHVLCSAYARVDIDPCLQAYTSRYIEPAQGVKKRLSRQIGVDSVRMLCVNMSESAAQGGKKIVVINPAEHLNINASNALLKFLEEPTNNSLIILISHDESQLSATIRSRCVKHQIKLPQTELVLPWLSQVCGVNSQLAIKKAYHLAARRPLIAKKMLENNQQALAANLLDDVSVVICSQLSVIELAKKWLKYKQTDFILDWLLMLISDMIKINAVSDKYLNLYNYGCLEKLIALCKVVDCAQAFNLYDYIADIRQAYDGVSDDALILEGILIEIQNQKRRPV